jgi:glycosyltransferase involved in cell wall biosynthesis
VTDVTFVTSTLAVGGAEKHLRQLAPRLRQHGFEPAVITLRHEGRFFDELRHEGVVVQCVRMRSRLDLVRARRALAPRTPRAQIVVSQGIDAHALGRIMARRVGAPHVAIEHGGPGLHHKLHHRLAYRLIAPGLAAAVAIADEQIPVLLQLGFRPERITVIPNGIEPLAPQRPAAETRRRLALPDGAFVAVLVATLRPEKRVGAFIGAVTAAHAQEPRVRGIVVGGGPDLAAARAAAAGTDGIVSVVGEVDDVSDVMAAADVVCLTSRAEGLPLVVLEAMSLGRPVLAPAVGGLVAAVENGVSGVLVPAEDDAAFAEALAGLARDETLVRSLGAAARARFEDRYTVERMTVAYANVLRGVLGAAGLPEPSR